MARRSPLPGYNHNLRHGGVVFHIQTEDHGLAAGKITSQLFCGGVIVATLRGAYTSAQSEAAIRKQMQEQHRSLLRALKRGEFDAKLRAVEAMAAGRQERGQQSARSSAQPSAQPSARRSGDEGRPDLAERLDAVSKAQPTELRVSRASGSSRGLAASAAATRAVPTPAPPTAAPPTLAPPAPAEPAPKPAAAPTGNRSRERERLLARETQRLESGALGAAGRRPGLSRSRVAVPALVAAGASACAVRSPAASAAATTDTTAATGAAPGAAEAAAAAVPLAERAPQAARGTERTVETELALLPSSPLSMSVRTGPPRHAGRPAGAASTGGETPADGPSARPPSSRK